MIRLLWHVYRYGHSVRVNRLLSPLPSDMTSKGWLYTCECGEQVSR